MGIGQGVGAHLPLWRRRGQGRPSPQRDGERVPAIQGDEGERQTPPFPRAHVIKDATFAYPSRPQEAVLNGCSLTLEPGRTTALVGPSGGGKSTIQLLLARFFDPDKGTVELDGVDLKALKPRWLRGNVVGVVTQEPVLLPGSIRDNLAYARPGATDDEIIAASKAANAHDFITRLADVRDAAWRQRWWRAGVGQKQRLAIARAFLKAPRVCCSTSRRAPSILPQRRRCSRRSIGSLRVAPPWSWLTASPR